MHRHILRCAFIGAVLCPIFSRADIPLTAGTAVHFASASEGRKILTAKDDFIARLSPFDRAARMKVGRPVSENEFLAFVGKNVTDWTAGEKHQLTAALEKLQPTLRAFALSFPRAIQLIKTTGAEEGNAAYTRAHAIILPGNELTKTPEDLAKVLCHELFHILTRQNPTLREELYAAIGFTKCNEIAFPPTLAARKITNPDAPRNDHFIRLQADGKPCLAVPILFSSDESYRVERGGEFFAYLNFRLLVVTQGADPLHVTPSSTDSAPELLAPEAVSGFYEQIGRNTDYIIHPEEILAENFALLILGKENVPSPEILQKMKTILTRPRQT